MGQTSRSPLTPGPTFSWGPEDDVAGLEFEGLARLLICSTMLYQIKQHRTRTLVL
jgi:hypothetical protein